MLGAFGFEALGVVVGDMYFVDPTPLAGQETPERGVRTDPAMPAEDRHPSVHASQHAAT